MSHELVQVPQTQNYLENLWKNAPKNVVQLKTSMHFADESKYITVDFDPKKYKTVELVMLTDVQFGHLSCKVDKLIEFRDWILKEPNRFVLFGGDMVDAATVLSVASPYENSYEPSQQLLRFCEIIMPIRHRVIAYVSGNHERRSCKGFGNIGQMLATLLKIPHSSGKQLIDVHYGAHDAFKISLWHGGTGSRTKGAKAQMLHRFMAQGDSQLYLVGHLHDVVLLFDWRERRDGKKITLEKFAGVMSSSFLEYWGTYAEVAGLAPSDTMMARIILEPSGKWEVTLR